MNRLAIPWLMCAVLGAVAPGASAYEIIDDSGVGIDDELRDFLLSRLADSFRDPAAVQFRRVHVSENALCGEFNAKNGFGAYVGFQPFYNLGIDKERPPPAQAGPGAVLMRCLK